MNGRAGGPRSRQEAQPPAPSRVLNAVPGESAIGGVGAGQAGADDILDPQGSVVRTLDLPGQRAGVPDLAWDGKDAGGNAVPDGNYTFRINATADNQVLKTTALSYGRVHAISGVANGVLLDFGDGRSASVDDVRRIL